EVGRVLPDQLQHLVSQRVATLGSGDWVGPYSFSEENIVEMFTEVRKLPAMAHGKPRYEPFDFSKYLEAGGGRRGLFFFKAEAWNPETRSSLGVRDQRLLLVTDLGLLVKDAADGT